MNRNFQKCLFQTFFILICKLKKNLTLKPKNTLRIFDDPQPKFTILLKKACIGIKKTLEII